MGHLIPGRDRRAVVVPASPQELSHALGDVPLSRGMAVPTDNGFSYHNDSTSSVLCLAVAIAISTLPNHVSQARCQPG